MHLLFHIEVAPLRKISHDPSYKQLAVGLIEESVSPIQGNDLCACPVHATSGLHIRFHRKSSFVNKEEVRLCRHSQRYFQTYRRILLVRSRSYKTKQRL